MSINALNSNNFDVKLALQRKNNDNNSRNANLPSNSIYAKQPVKKAFSAQQRKDNSLSFTDGLKAFGKGLVSPVTSMFSSPKSFAIGAGMIVASTALVFATGGAAAPFLVSAGLGMGAFQGIKAGRMMAKAKTKKQKEDAIYEAGGAVGTIGLSLAGAKSSLKQTGLDVSKMGTLSATSKVIKATPQSIKGSYQIFREGIYKDSFKNATDYVFAPRYQKKLSNEIYKNTSAHFKNDIEALKKPMPLEFADAMTARIKGRSSTLSKLVAKGNLKENIAKIQRDKSLSQAEKETRIERLKADTAKFYSDKEHAKSKIDDTCGARIETNKPVDQIVESLIKGMKDGNFKILMVKNYRGPKNENGFYFSKEHIEALQDAGVKCTQSVKASGYCSSQLKIKLPSGIVGELQVRGKNVGEIAELEHTRYDINKGKDIFKGHTELIRIFNPYKKALKALTPEQAKAYENYFVQLYEYARNTELGIKGKEPELPQGFDNVLSIESLRKIHKQYVDAKIPTEQYYGYMPETAVVIATNSFTNN